MNEGNGRDRRLNSVSRDAGHGRRGTLAGRQTLAGRSAFRGFFAALAVLAPVEVTETLEPCAVIFAELPTSADAP